MATWPFDDFRFHNDYGFGLRLPVAVGEYDVPLAGENTSPKKKKKKKKKGGKKKNMASPKGGILP